MQSAGNYIQYPVINHNGKEYIYIVCVCVCVCVCTTVINHNGEEYIYIYIVCVCTTESFCCVAKINTTLQINYTSIKLKRKKRQENE